jgi:IS5 family transposase
MLRVYILQQWFNLSDPGAEDALCESPVLWQFAGVDWAVPPRQMRRRSFASAACWRRRNYAARFWIR